MSKLDKMSEEQAMKLVFAGLAYAEDSEMLKSTFLRIHDAMKDDPPMIDARNQVKEMLSTPLAHFPMDVEGIDFEEKYKIGAAIICVMALFDFLETEATAEFDKELAKYESAAQEKESSFQEEHL